MGLIRTSASSFDVDITPGTYPMTCVGVGVVTVNVKGESKDLYEWRFIAINAEGRQVDVSGLTGLATGPKSRTWSYLVALLGPENVRVDMDFNEPDLVGRSALGTMAINQDGNLRLAALVPMPRGMAGPGIAAPAPAPQATVSPIRQQPAPQQLPAQQTVRAAVGSSDDVDDLPF